MLIDPLDPAAALPFEDEDLTVEPAANVLPRLSVVIAIENAADLLERALRGLLLNDLAGVEIIVMDGASTDATPAILKHYETMFAQVVSEPGSGPSAAINKGFAAASGDMFCWLTDDVLILPNTLHKVRSAFLEAPEAAVVVGNAAVVDLALEVQYRVRSTPAECAVAALLDAADDRRLPRPVFVTRAAWEAVGPLDETLRYAMDIDLMLTMARQGPCQHVPAEVAFCIDHPDAETRRHRAAWLAELALVKARHGHFAAARKTLARLVKLYEEAAGAAGLSDAAIAGEAGLAARRLAALENNLEANKALFLQKLGRDAS